MLKGMVVAISGAAGRIGSAFAEAVVQNSGRVVLGDVLEKEGKKLELVLGTEKSVFLLANLSKKNEIKAFFDNGVARFGRIDAAVHCSYPRSKQWGTRFEEIEDDLLAEDLKIQLGGSILFSQQAIRLFCEQGHGNLVHVSSIQGVAAPKFEHYDGTKMCSPIEYSAIKSGIIAISKYLAKYTKGENIRVNCISPGGILDNQPESFLKKYKSSCTSKGMLDASDLTGTLIYLLSDQSKYLNGQNIVVDDGWTL